MNKSSSCSSSPLSPRTKSKPQMTTIITPVMLTNEDEINEMPILTPEVPILTPIIDNEMIGTIDSKVIPNDVNFVDLVPPVLSPALDQNSNKSKLNESNVSEKTINKRKYKIETFKEDSSISYSLFNDNEYNFNVFDMNFPKKVKKSSKSSTKVNKIPKNTNKFLQKSIQKSIQKSKGKLYNNNNTNSFNNNSNKSENISNDWSVDCNHTMTSTNTSYPEMYSFMDYRKDSANDIDFESILSNNNNNNIDNSFKLIKPKIYKKSKTSLNSQTKKRTKKLLFNDLIGVKKPEAETDEIEGIVFQTFENEESINLFTKFEMLEKEQQKDQTSNNFKYKIKSYKSGKVIFPTKTKDITKIKGWREKLFSAFDQKDHKRSISQSSKGSKSAFVSDILDGYLKNKSDLRMNYLDPDLAPPPDDSPIFSASVLKMPEFNNSMPPPINPSTSHSTTSSTTTSPNKRKSNFGRSKGLKNKLDLKTDFNDMFDFLDDENVSSEQFLPQFPVIRETLWPETPLNEDQLDRIYEEYVKISYNELQMMKKYNCPSFIMDDHYARYALSALQCNERITFANNDFIDSKDNVMSAVGLVAKPKIRELSPVKEIGKKVTGRYRKDRDADLAKMIAMGNRSRRQIRLPSRFHESSLLMGNQWIIPDYDSKGKTGKRRLQQEQKRLQELHQRQLELEQRNNLVHINDQISTNNDDSLLTNRSLKKKKSIPKNSKIKPKVKAFTIPVVTADYPIKIPQHQQRLKQLQIMRNNQNKSTNKKSEQLLANNKSFTSLYSLATQTNDDKRHVSLSAKAAASASQRAVVNQLFYQLFDTISPEKQNMFSRNGKINKLEVIKEAIEAIEKLRKRDQQLCYIRKLLSMWNHKLLLCSKVAQKDMKPEAFKVVNEVMNTYKNSMCYKVGEALEAKRKELMSQKKMLSVTNPNQSSSANNTQIINIPTTNTNGTLFKSPKAVTHRLILPKLSPFKNIPKNSSSETVISSINNSNNYPKLTTPDLHQRSVSDFSVDTEFISREGSLLNPPILTTRPTVLKPFIMNSTEDPKSSNSVTGPIINVPNISRIKSMTKSINICKTKPQLIGSNKSHVSNSKMSSSLINSSATRLKFPLNCIKMTGPFVSNSESESNSGEKRNLMMGINAFIPIGSSANNITGVTSAPNVSTSSNTQLRPQSKSIFSPHAYAGKSVIITSETPLANEDLSKIVASIASNPENFKKVPVRLSNGLSALTIPGPLDIPLSGKVSNYTSINAASGATSQLRNSSPIMTNNQLIQPNDSKISDLSEDSKSLTNKSNSFCAINQSSNLTLNNVSAKPNILQKQSVLPKMNAIIGVLNDNELNGVKTENTDTKPNVSD